MARTVPLVVLRGARVAALAVVPQAGHPVVPVVIPVAPLAALVVRPAAAQVVPVAAPQAALVVRLAAVPVVPVAAPQAAPPPNNPRR